MGVSLAAAHTPPRAARRKPCGNRRRRRTNPHTERPQDGDQMRDRSHSTRLTHASRAHVLTVTTLVGAILLAGCGGSSGDGSTTASTAAGGNARTAASSATASGATSAGANTPGAGGSGPLAFAKCMRADGVPNFPDPHTGAGPVFNTAGIDPSSPAFQTAQAKCQRLMGGAVGGPFSFGARTHPSAQTLAKLLRIARCMRQHGVPQFPDPQTSVPSNPSAAGASVITDFDGVILVFPATLNLQAPAYRHALTACGAPPLGLPH